MVKTLKVNAVSKVASAHGQRGMEKEIGEGRLLRHLCPHSDSLPVDKSVCFMNDSWRGVLPA